MYFPRATRRGVVTLIFCEAKSFFTWPSKIRTKFAFDATCSHLYRALRIQAVQHKLQARALLLCGSYYVKKFERSMNNLTDATRSFISRHLEVLVEKIPSCSWCHCSPFGAAKREFCFSNEGIIKLAQIISVFGVAVGIAKILFGSKDRYMRKSPNNNSDGNNDYCDYIIG